MFKKVIAVAAASDHVRQPWLNPIPTKPITFNCAVRGVSPTDVIARIVGEHMSKHPVNKSSLKTLPALAPTTGITRGAQATADGYTIMMGHMGTHGAAPALCANLNMIPRKISSRSAWRRNPVLWAKKDLQTENLKEFVEYLKTNQDKVNRSCWRRFGLTLPAPC